MSLFLMLISIIGFILYFYGIGLWYLGFIPLVFLGIFFAYHGVTKTLTNVSWTIVQKYSLYVAWIILLAGFLGVLNFFGVQSLSCCLWILWVSLALWIGSYLWDYQDGKSVFQLWFYLAIAFLLIIAFAQWGVPWFWEVFRVLRTALVWIIWFQIFVLWIWKKSASYLWYQLAILVMGMIFRVCLDQVSNMYIALSICSLVLTWVCTYIYKILQQQPLTDEKKAKISVRRILAGERITQGKKYFSSAYAEQIFHFIAQMPQWAKQMLELFNVLFVAILIVYYVGHVAGFVTVNHIFYRVSILIFISNVFLLKKIGYNSLIQNLVVFLVINFAVYVSFFSYFNGNVWSVAVWGIIWNIVSASLIFSAHTIPFFSRVLHKIDYIYRIIATIIAMLVNVILLMWTDLPGELIFFLVLVYLGLQSMIIYYSAKYVGRMGKKAVEMEI